MHVLYLGKHPIIVMIGCSTSSKVRRSIISKQWDSCGLCALAELLVDNADNRSQACASSGVKVFWCSVESTRSMIVSICIVTVYAKWCDAGEWMLE